MAYKNILVHVDNSKNLKAILDAACGLAARSGSHLTGVHVLPYLDTVVVGSSSVPQVYFEEQRKSAIEEMAQAKEAFEKAADAAGCLSEWFEPTGRVDEEIVRLGKYADIIVMGQSGNFDNPSARHTLENQVLLASSRPVLIIPYTGFKQEIGQHILVAWNDSTEATRAINDAMPLLQSAKLVDVMSVVKAADSEQVPSSEMCIYLARHDVKAEATKAFSGELSTANILLNTASDRGIDLIVMGAYGHSRLREWIMGGATYNILRHMTVPVLMSH